MTGIYLLHFDPPLHHARHYLGWASDIDKRLARHMSGKGARLVKAVIEAGCRVELVAVWEGASRDEERRMKNSNAVGKRYCPICSWRDVEN
jgi:predicted GIY-YIG superfamily endonuclease